MSAAAIASYVGSAFAVLTTRNLLAVEEVGSLANGNLPDVIIPASAVTLAKTLPLEITSVPPICSEPRFP